MDPLSSRHRDLRDWFLEELAEPQEGLGDARALRASLEALNFGEIGQRQKVAEKLRAVLQTPGLDLAP
eukprot:11954173-Alexandrium_andersonii.AAC.1